MLHPDYRDMLLCLNDHEAEYVVVGAHAMAVHGFVRSTGDFDVWVRSDPQNSQRVFEALAEFGAPMDGLTPSSFAQSGLVLQIGVAPVRIDILTTISGHITFDEAFNSASIVLLDGIAVRVLSAELLLRNKLAAGRPKDLLDAENLRGQG